MDVEIKDLLKHDTWELIPRNQVPKSHKVAKSKWVYRIKMNKDGSIERFKSRFVVCGYSQVKGVDYTHAFSATMLATTNAFTQSEIDKVIYVEPPKGDPQVSSNGAPCVLKLRNGTKQASRMWQLKLRKHLVEKMGLTNSTHGPCFVL